MTLLITLTAAVISTAIWYNKAPDNKMKLDILIFIYWGVSLLFLGDAIMEYIKLGADYFTPAASDMLNDSFLGFSLVVIGAAIWIIILLIDDPKGILGKKSKGR